MPRRDFSKFSPDMIAAAAACDRVFRKVGTAVYNDFEDEAWLSFYWQRADHLYPVLPPITLKHHAVVARIAGTLADSRLWKIHANMSVVRVAMSPGFTYKEVCPELKAVLEETSADPRARKKATKWLKDRGYKKFVYGRVLYGLDSCDICSGYAPYDQSRKQAVRNLCEDHLLLWDNKRLMARMGRLVSATAHAVLGDVPVRSRYVRKDESPDFLQTYYTKAGRQEAEKLAAALAELLKKQLASAGRPPLAVDVRAVNDPAAGHGTAVRMSVRYEKGPWDSP